MKTIFTLTISILLGTILCGQTIADFENFGLAPGENINEDTSGDGFRVLDLALQNEYNANYDSWSGWAISADTDTTTPGFGNQYSAMAGAGFENSTTYAVSYAFGENIIGVVDGAGVDETTVLGMYVTNNAYAYYSMLDGDAYAKKFGGITGEDPDFYSIIFKKYLDGVLSTDSVEFFLADFRAANSDEDYILKDWTWVDLSSLGLLDSLSIVMNSSDVGSFGINTPLYFCVDNITVENTSVSSTEIKALEVDIFPNLVSENLTISLVAGAKTEVKLVSLNGEIVFTQSFFGGRGEVNLSELTSGMYILNVSQDGKMMSTKIIKQ